MKTNKRNARLQWLHNRIASGAYPNESRLSEKFGISHRQAQRDIGLLRHELKAPLAYDGSRRGFYYTAPFSLPLYITEDNDDDYSGITAKFSGKSADPRTVVQLQIPYTAEIAVPDKLAALELQKFITVRKPKNRYICEFHSIELFLGVIMSLDTEVKFISPLWLRDRAVSAAEKIIQSNKKS